MVDCLGHGEYAARIVARTTLLGRSHPIGELPTLEAGTWARRQQTTTEASITVALEGEGCQEVLRQADAWRHELELYRDADLVWAGPIMDVIANPDAGTATVTAKDMAAWFDKRVLVGKFIHRQQDIADIFAAYLRAAFALDDPGIIVETTPTGILADRTIAATDLRKLATELSELARTGCDWTATGRTFWIGGQEVAGRTSRITTRLTDEAFRTAPQTRRSGSGQANETWIRGNGVQGHAGGPDPQDGVLLQDVRDEQSIEDQGSADAAARTWRDRVAEVMTYLEGDHALSADAPVDVQQLIPGVLVPVDVGGGGVVPYSGTLRLESVTGSFGPDGEDITVALQPIGTTTDEAA